MTEEPAEQPEAAEADVGDGPTTDLVLPARRPVVRPARRWPELAVRARRQLVELRDNPAAMLAVSAAATVGSAVLTAGLRRALGGAPVAGPTRRVAVDGYVVHEVHVIHHVVHHVVRPPGG